MMAYKPSQESRSRIENIKKKFEVVNDPTNSVVNGTPKLSQVRNGEHSFSHNNHTSRGKPPSTVKSTSSFDCGTPPRMHNLVKTERQLSNSSNKGNIRRSPAFRCDKMVRGRPMVGHAGVSWERPRSVVDHRVRMFEDEQQKGIIVENRLQLPLETKIVKNNMPIMRHTVIEKMSFESEDANNLTITKNEVIHNNNVHLKQNNVDLLREIDVPAYCISDVKDSYASVLKSPKSNENVSELESKNTVETHKKVDFKEGKTHPNEHTDRSCSTKVLKPNESSLCLTSKMSVNKIGGSEIFEVNEVNKRTETVELKCETIGLTNTLKAALKAPLPEGPPPKKPPRTFAHHSPVMCAGPNGVQEKIHNLNSVPSTAKKELPPLFPQQGLASDVKSASKNELNLIPVRSKTESHIMLKKLENALLNHQQGVSGVVMRPRTPLLNNRRENGLKDLSSDDHLNSPAGKPGRRAGPLPSLPSDRNLPSDGEKTTDSKQCPPEKQDNSAILVGCLDSLNCVSGGNPLYTQGNFYEKLIEKQSEFFVDVKTYLRSSVSENVSLLSETQEDTTSLQTPKTEEHIYAEPYGFLSDDEKLQRSIKPKVVVMLSGMSDLNNGENNVFKSVSSSVRQLEALNDTKPKSQALHYMCTLIPTANPLDRIDALTTAEGQSSDVAEAVNTNVTGPKQCEPEGCTKSESVLPKVESSNEEKNSSHKAPFLRLTTLVKNLQSSPSTESINKLDRSKIQLFMNQAFGSPLQGMPLTPLDGTSSDCESLASSPDEGFPPLFGSEDEGQHTDAVKESVKGPTASEDSTSLTSVELSRLVEERKVYVRRVSSRIFSTSQRLSKPDAFPHLFQCFLLVGLNLDCERRVKVPYVKTKYPAHAEVPPLIEHLCFPDAADWPPPSLPPEQQQSYSLVVTNEAGERKFGYCRRVMPEGASMCLPLAYCIISPFRARGFYYKILSELESKHGQPEWLQTAFIKELYACEFPNPGQGLKLPVASHSHTGHSDSPLSTIAGQLRRPLDTRLEERDLMQLFATLSVPVLLQVFGSLLLERKVLFISNSLSKLSSCIEALESLLYPFSWQYTFIPVLPSTKLGVCEAPTPYVIGILKGKDGRAPIISIDDGIIVELDEPRVLQCVGDESSILPPRLKRCLKMALQLVASTTQDHEPSRNVLVSEAFIRMFVEVCGHYPTHIVTQQDGKRVFERESFIKAVPSRGVQLFLEWFTETAMFSTFMEIRLADEPEARGIFEQRAMEHSEEMDKNTMLFLRNYKAINKKVKTFGDRLKDWTPFT